MLPIHFHVDFAVVSIEDIPVDTAVEVAVGEAEQRPEPTHNFQWTVPKGSSCCWHPVEKQSLGIADHPHRILEGWVVVDRQTDSVVVVRIPGE